MSSEIVALSDLHLGTRHCRGEALLDLLEALDTRRLILCGDVIDLTDPGPRWPALHTAIIARLLQLTRDGTRVDVLCGNHDGLLRAFLPTTFGDMHLADQVCINIGDERVLFFHGDAVDRTCATPAWLRRLGAMSYDGLMWLGEKQNRIRASWGGRPISLLGAFRRHLPVAIRHVERFENACAAYAVEQNCDAVICGHIHVPRARRVVVAGQEITYRNCGDWVEHATGWEYRHERWSAIGAITDTIEAHEDEAIPDAFLAPESALAS